MIDVFKEFINLIKDDHLKKMGPRGYIKFFAYFIAAPLIIISAVYHFIFFEAPPPRITNVSIGSFNDTIKLSYDRSSYYGAENNKDIIEWEIDKIIRADLRNKMSFPRVYIRSRTAAVRCLVTGFDGYAKAKTIKSHTLFVPPFSTASSSLNANEAVEETLETTIEKIKRMQREGEGIKIIAGPGTFAALKSDEDALKEKAALELKATETLKNSVSVKDAQEDKGRVVRDESTAEAAPAELEFVLKGSLADILDGSRAEGAVVSLGTASAVSDRWGGFELRSKKGEFIFTITSSAYYTRTITKFVHDGDEIYNEKLIPKTFKISDYDEVARPNGGKTRKWKELPTVVIHNGKTEPSKYIPDAKDKDAIRDTIRKFVAPEFNLNIYGFNNALIVIEDNCDFNRKYGGYGYITIRYDPWLDYRILGSCGVGATEYLYRNCRINLKHNDKTTIIHELLHAMGFTGHSSNTSIMSPTGNSELTALDKQLIKIHCGLRAGTSSPHNNATKDGI